MGGAGFDKKPKTTKPTNPVKNVKTAAKKVTKPVKPAAKQPAPKKQNKKTGHRFRALMAASSELSTGVMERAIASIDPNAQITLSPAHKVTGQQLIDLAGKLPKTTAEMLGWHWDSFQSCTRWTRAGLSEGEMRFFDSNSDHMYAGGGFYFASEPESSAMYGIFPCRVYIKSGVAIYDVNIVSAQLKFTPTAEEKVQIGLQIPFIHQYALTGVASPPPMKTWYVTHHWDVFSRFEGGTYNLPNSPNQIVPHFIKTTTGNIDSSDNEITTSLQLYAYWRKLSNPDTLVPKIEPDGAKWDLTEGLKWMKSFSFLFSYIDGPSLYRALSIKPDDPFDVFEKQRFPNYQNIYEQYIYGRIDSQLPSIWGLSASGVFGDGKSTADAWADKMVKEFLPKLYEQLSGGGVMKFRAEEVRAGGDEEGRNFITTPTQVSVMKANPYLIVEDKTLPDGTVTAHYYYPDPLHLNPALQSRISPALWTACQADVAAVAGKDEAGRKAYRDSSDSYKQNTLNLMGELIREAFKRVYGKSAAMEAGGLQIMMDLVSIHPCTDFNGRTTRFVGVVAALESRLEPPIAFMSDFDLVTDRTLYGEFLKTATAAYLRLKLALTGELLSGVCNARQPNHYGVSYWAQLPTDALAPFTGGKPVTFDASDWPIIQHRQFVALMDKKLGKTWKGR